ncbi:MAG TPA: TfuA-like protein [Myxococcaceae bacterium]|nr:TfuA-like protein [Myxococcaceae bacterium]
MTRRPELVAFLGPSRPPGRHHHPSRWEFLGPARQGDVWRALDRRPRAIALIDGVFESQPSVWHREIADALAEGVMVLGASSMGALRAAELWPLGMIGVGEIFRAYRDGALVDDAEVALLHAADEHGYRPLTVPLVNVRHAAATFRRERLLTRAQANALVARAEAVFYQERRWPDLLEPLSNRAQLLQRLARGDLDLKQQDAAACLRAAADWLRSGQRPPPLDLPPPPSHARHRRGLPPSLPPAETLLAAFARSMGLRGDDAALSALALRHAPQMVPDGPGSTTT